MQAPNIDQLVAKFVELRDRKSAIEKKAEADKAELTKIMDAIEERIKLKLHELGAKSLKTDHGTAYISYKESATVADWDTLLDYIVREERYALLEKRVSKTEVKAIMEEDRNGSYVHPPPPGVNFVRFETINVRRS